MKILCLVDKYYPDSSANTICCDHIANYFKSLGHVVDFVAIKNNIDDKDYDKINNSNVIKIDTYNNALLKKYGKKYNAKKWLDFPWLFRKFWGVIQKIKMLKRPSTQFISLDTVDYDSVYSKIAKINKHYDLMFSFSMPFAFNVVAKELLKRNLADKWYPIFLDAFVYNKCLKKSKIKYRQKLAIKTLSKSTKIFMVKGILEENLNNNFNPEYHNKIQEIYIPMLTKNSLPTVKKEDSSNINLVYAGAFYADIRRPHEMLDILSLLPKKINIKVFGYGCENIVKEKAKQFNQSKLFIGGTITHQQCLEEIAKSDILINLGNSITNQMPSKIFEYISFGKPIINFYFCKEDMCLQVLKNYPLCININLTNYTQKDIENLKDFITKNCHTQLTFDQATKNLQDYKVDVIAKKIYEAVTNE